MKALILPSFLVLSALGTGPLSMLAQETPAPRTAPTYTEAQARLGRAAYDQNCASCHGPGLDDGAFGPALKGPAFMRKYGAKSADGLFGVISTTMPTVNPGALSGPVYAQILAYILQSNDILPGGQELPSDAKRLATMTIPAGGFSFMAFSPYTAPPPPVSRPNPFDRFTPVTDALLASPPSGDWLTWRRSYDAHGFSPLTQIDRSNVRTLRVAWGWTLPAGSNESTPIVHDGVLFIHGFGDRVQALDAATGDLLWQYTRQLPDGAPRSNKRGIALHGDRVYVGTSDVHVIALDAKTGRLLWDQEIGDFKVREGLTSGPLVAKGKVMVGTTGTGVGAKPGGPQVVGLDAETGRVAWRFNTIPKPGEPGGDSWNGVPWDERTGASVWTPGSYDPTVGLAFFGTGNTYDTARLMPRVNRPGITNDALYTNSTLAIDPDTGRLVWHFQHHPNDQWDLDWAFERQVVRLPVNGQVRPVVITAGKSGVYEALDAQTGRFLFAHDLGFQNVFAAIDPRTGAKTINTDVIPGDGKVKMVCPHAAGAKNFLPAAYSATSKVVVVPLVEACMDLFPVPGGGRGALSSGVNWGVRPRPDSDGKFGILQAINIETREIVWTTRQRAPQTSGVLATAGGVIVAGSFDRYVRAYDDANGAVLWETRLNDVSSSSPISYSVDGRQYIAVVVGQGGFQANSYAPLVPEFRSPPDRGAAIWVFALPESPADSPDAPR